MDDALFPVASPSLPGLEKIDCPAAIAELVLLADNGFQGWRDWFRAAGLRGMHLPAAHMLSDSSGVLRAAAAGIGAALARKRIVESYLKDGVLQRLPGPALTARFSYYAVHPAHRMPSPAAEAFIDWLRQEAEQDAGVLPQVAPVGIARRTRKS
jgi:DNA-binding transcriptional LysR family regulator